MNLYNVLLNNKIPFVLHESDDSENVIYCKSFSDYLFNVGTFTTRTKEVILEYVVDNAEKYVVADVTFDNGDCYRDVRFKVVVNENTETPYSTINLNLLNNKTQVTIPQQSQQIVEDVEELVERPAPVHISAPIIEAPDYTETINEALKLQKKLNVEKEEIKKQKILLEKQDIIKRKLSEYKQELLEDYFNATKRQTELLESNIQENITTAEYELNQRITNTFNDFNLQLEEYKNKTKEEQIQLIVKELGETAATIKLEITDIISNKFNSEHEQVVDLLYEKTKLLEETYQRKLIFELEQYKERLFEEYKVFSSDTVEQVLKAKTDITYQAIDDAFDSRQAEIEEYYDNRLIESRQEIDNFAAEIKAFSTHLTELEKAFLESEEKFKNTLTEKEKVFAESLDQKIINSKAEFGSIIVEFTKRLPVITSNINTLETKVKTLIEEKTKSFKEDFSTTQQDYIAKTAQYWARRILDLGGGGGSVAVQYANGGTMNGDLNVNANYLSGGVNLLDIFALQPDLDHQTLSFNESTAQLSISNGNTVSLSALSGEFTDRLVNGSYQAVLSGNGYLILPGAIAFPDNTTQTTAFTGNPDSSNWDSTYTTVKNTSAYWADTRNDVTFEKNVTIQGNLTALGTSTFQNTIFTTTSALSVVNLGRGPALYVFQASGPYDVASFYDGDGVEVLHVGNAQGGGNPLGQVGINTSYPSAELTVNGAISSNGVITVLGGNSNQWNSAYTNLVTNSATYLSGFSDNKYFYKDINFTANANTKYSSGTRFGAITATLPSGVVVGDCIEFFDADGTWNTNSLIIDNNSYFIEGIYDRLSCNTRYGAFKLIYTGTDSVGWRIVPLPKHSVNSPTLASVTTNGQVITASSSQFNLIIDNSVDYFTFYTNSTTQISLSNRYDVNNFANCSLSAFNATNVSIDTNPLYIQNTAILSSGSDNYYTLYYSNTGSSIVNVSYSQSVPRSLARDQVVIAYNQNSQESIDVANYYKNNRPIFSEVRILGLNIPQAVYPARINTNGVYFCASGCDIDVPYEGCRKYDFISTSLVQTQIVDPIANYISTYPTTKYIVFTLDVPTLVIPDNIWGLSVLSATQVPRIGANVTKSVQLRTGIFPTYITGALSADCIAYIDKLKTATTDGITLYKSRSKIYTEDSYGAGYDGFDYYQYPEITNTLSAYSVYRSGAPTRKSSGQGLTGIFMDQSSSWSHNTGNIAISSIAIWGTWGFNGRRYIAPKGPYRYSISGEGEVPGLSSMSYYTYPEGSGKLTFTGPDNGWYFNYTIESWNGAPHGGAYGYFGGNAGNKFWGSFPTTYTGVKTFSAFKASAQYSRGLRPLRHSCYTQYFAKNAFGGINYENTPVVWVGHSFEPFYPGAITNTYMRRWAGGSIAYDTITASLQNSNPMVIIGDPLVKVSLNSI